jgi:hypothetical protein
MKGRCQYTVVSSLLKSAMPRSDTTRAMELASALGRSA